MLATMTRLFAVLGVPTSAGAHYAGQDLAPAALRDHGLVERLRAAGLDVTDEGDLAGEVFEPAGAEAPVRNLDAVLRVALRVADAVEGVAGQGRIPIVLGGDCTITLGVVAGLQRGHDDVRLAYFDGDADLGTPERSGSGILDATGIAHLIGAADTALGGIGTKTPMLADHELVMLGYDAGDPDSFDPTVLAAHPSLQHFSDAEVRSEPIGVARRAVEALDHAGARIVVHFDVDAVDSADLPLANYPHYRTGVPLAVAGQVLETLLATPRLAAVVLTEVNPTHDGTGEQLDRYVDMVAGAFAHRASQE
jgi:arginase